MNASINQIKGKTNNKRWDDVVWSASVYVCASTGPSTLPRQQNGNLTKKFSTSDEVFEITSSIRRALNDLHKQ